MINSDKLKLIRNKLPIIIGLVLAAIFAVTILENLSLLWAYIKGSPVFGLPSFLKLVLESYLTRYAVLLIPLYALLLVTANRRVKPRLIALIYFVFPFLVFPIATLGTVTSFTIAAIAIFAIVGLGIWLRKTLAYAIAIILNLVATLGSIYLFIQVVGTPCEGLGCLGIGILSLLSMSLFGFTLLTTPFLWYQLRTEKFGASTKRAFSETVILEIILLVIAGTSFGPPYLKIYGDVKQVQEQNRPRWEQERIARDEKLQEAIKEGFVYYPTYLPRGWNALSKGRVDHNGAVKIQYQKYGAVREVLQIRQMDRSLLGDKSLYDLGKDHWYKEDVSINGMPGRHFIWTTGACDIVDEIHEVWWFDGDAARNLYCSCPCLLSLDELIKIGESMESPL